jgi:serine/threonine protein kinase
MRVIIQAIGNTPISWGDVLFDYDGQPTTDSVKGPPLEIWDESRSLMDLVYKIWDQPQGGIVSTGAVREEQMPINKSETEPYPTSFSNMFWKPSAVRIDNVFLHGYDDETDELLAAMPKISKHEAALLYNLLSKIFVYDPADRITAAEMLRHPWFSINNSLTKDDLIGEPPYR